MFCEKCGAENAENALFCGKCGARLQDTAAGSKVNKPRHISKRMKWAIGICSIGLLCLMAFGAYVLEGKKDTEDYSRNMSEAKQFMDGADYDHAETSYNGLADIYIGECSFDKAEEVIRQGRENGVELSAKQTKLENAREKLAFMISLRDSMQTDPAGAWKLLQEAKDKYYTITYLQNNKIVKYLEDGDALVYNPKAECYTGEIQGRKRNGIGTQMGWYHGSYYTATGNWEDNVLNGQATLYYDQYSLSGPYINMTVTGNFTTGLYDGEMLMEWQQENEGVTHRGVAHAVNGTLAEIETDRDGHKIYVKSDDGWRWWKTVIEDGVAGVPNYIAYFE